MKYTDFSTWSLWTSLPSAPIFKIHITRVRYANITEPTWATPRYWTWDDAAPLWDRDQFRADRALHMQRLESMGRAQVPRMSPG